MSFLKFASPHSSMGANKTGPKALRGTDLQFEEVDDNATYDLSPEAEAARVEAAAAAVAAANAAAAQAAQAAALAASASSSASASAPVAPPVPKLVFSRVLEGTNPETTWPGTKYVDLLNNNQAHYSGDAEARDRFVVRPAAWARFPEVEKLNIAPYTYCIDLEEDEAKRLALIEDMNKHNGAPTLATAYDADNVLTAPRIWCKWPLPLAPTPDDSQMTKTTLHFQTGLPDAASTADWYAYLLSLPGKHQTGLPLSLAPGGIEQLGITRFVHNLEVPFRDRAVHAIPVSVRISETTNTSDVDFQVELGVPNIVGASQSDSPLFASKSEPIGVGSSGRVLASSAETGQIALFRAGVYNSPERPRWAGVDRAAEKKKFLGDLDGNKSRTNTLQQQVVFVRVATDVQPLNMAQYITRTYPAHLTEASKFLGLAPPRMNKTGKKDGAKDEDPNLVGFVGVAYDALCAVLDYFCDLYSPHNFAVNQHKWQLTAHLTDTAIGVHSLAVIAAREKAQKNVKPVRLSYKVELIQVPYEGATLLTADQRARLKQIEVDHDAMAARARTASFSVLKQLAACEPVLATKQGEVCSLPLVVTPHPKLPAPRTSNSVSGW